MTTRPTVVVIDDDEGVREALKGLFESVGLATEIFGSVHEFSIAGSPERAGCIVLDVRLPGQSGIDFQEALARDGHPHSVVLISAHVDVPMCVRAMKAGAIDVLPKPVREQDLLDAVHRALDQERARREAASSKAALEAKFAYLTKRERQIMTLAITGMPNKQIAFEASITEATVKLHRGHIMRKMGADSLVSLVRMSDQLQSGGPAQAARTQSKSTTKG